MKISKCGRLMAIVMTIGLMVGFTACGDSDSNPQAQAQEPASVDAPAGEMECIQDLTSDQRTQMLEAFDKAPASEKQNDDGTSDVCVLKEVSPGNFEPTYYSAADAQRFNFGDYMMYRWMFGRTAGMMYAMSDGGLDGSDLLMMSLLTDFDGGRPYHPYSIDGGNYVRNSRPVYISNTTVTNVNYGGVKQTWKPGATTPPPPPTGSGYKAPKPTPAPIKAVATFKRDAGGKLTTAKVDNSPIAVKKAASAQATQAKKAPGVVKRTDSGGTIPRSPSSGNSSGGTSKPKPSSGSSGGSTKTKPSSGSSGGSKPKPKSGSGSSSRKSSSGSKSRH